MNQGSLVLKIISSVVLEELNPSFAILTSSANGCLFKGFRVALLRIFHEIAQ
jgi:hypothetical protein